MKRVYWRVMRGMSIDRPSPIAKQAPLVLTYLIAVVLVVSVPGLAITDAPVAILGNAFMVVATGMAVVFTWTNRFDRLIALIPAIDILAMGAFRAGTGGHASIFAVLVVLPVIWLASFEGRRFIAYTGVGTMSALAMPVLVGVQSAPHSTVDWARGLFVPAVFAVIAAIVNEISRQSRVQVRSIARLAQNKEEMLQRTIAAAAKLQQSESRALELAREFRGVWDSVTEQAVISTDVTGLIELWNPGATLLLGWHPDETEGTKHISELHLRDELEHRARELNFPPGVTVLMPGFSALVESARLGRAESREWTYVRADGEHVPVLLSVTQRTDQDGNVTGFLFVASDVSKAREIARLKDEFIGLISHELRTPLSSILGYLELLRDDDPLTPTQEQYLDVLERNAQRLLRLVGDLLLTAQLDAGQFRMESRGMRLEHIVTGSVESARPHADAAGVSINAVLPDDSAIVRGDPTRLGQAMDNLLSNAIKFTPRGGRVTVAVTLVGENVVVTVSDTGLGIPEAELSQLFGRFFRASTATRNAVPGVGLGLTITRAIVAAHGGTLEVESEVGIGTSFSVTLPLDRSGAPTGIIPLAAEA